MMVEKLSSLIQPILRASAALVLALLVFTAVPLAAPAALWGQGSEVEMEIKQDASELLSSFGSYGVEQRRQAVSAMGDAFDSLDRQSDAVRQLLENSLTGMNAAAREQAQSTLSEIDRQRSDLADLLEQVQRSPDEAWDSVKEQFTDATSALLQTLENASV